MLDGLDVLKETNISCPCRSLNLGMSSWRLTEAELMIMRRAPEIRKMAGDEYCKVIFNVVLNHLMVGIKKVNRT
jgi:hypothetical protein